MKEKTKLEIWVFCLYGYGIFAGSIMTRIPEIHWWCYIILAIPVVFASEKIMSFFKVKE